MYVSEAVSFWTAGSSIMSILSTNCAVAWGRPVQAEHEWLKMATAHADCYLEAHAQTWTETTAPAVTAFDTDASATTNDNDEPGQRLPSRPRCWGHCLGDCGTSCSRQCGRMDG